KIPHALHAARSKCTATFPKVINDERRIAIGNASGTMVAEKYIISLVTMNQPSPLPTMSSMYFHKNCMSRMKIETKKVRIKGPIKERMTKVVNFFTLYLQEIFVVQDTKLRFSEEELRMMADSRLFLIRHEIMQKISSLLGKLEESLLKIVSENHLLHSSDLRLKAR